MTDNEHTDPERRRLSALLALRTWAVQDGGDARQRAVLVAAAWDAGERRLTELARAADVDQQTAFDDLLRHDIRPTGLPSDTPSPTLLEHRHVAVLADRLSQVLLPTMVGPVTEPLAGVAWAAQQVLAALARALDPNPDPKQDSRTAWLHDIAHRADTIRRDAHRQLAAECTDAELATLTVEDVMSDASVLGNAFVEAAEVRLTMPDGSTVVRVDLDTVGRYGPQPEGWTRWSGTAELGPVDRFRHLEVAHLLGELAEVISDALPEELLR